MVAARKQETWAVGNAKLLLRGHRDADPQVGHMLSKLSPNAEFLQ